MNHEFLPVRVELRHYRLGNLFAFSAQVIPGLHVVAGDLRQAFENLAPIASEIMRRTTGVGVTYHLDESLIAFQTRMTLLAALRPTDQAVPATDLVQQKFLSQRRLLRALIALDAQELGKKDRHAAYWRAKGGQVFSVMGPNSRTQSGTLLYAEAYARDLIAMIARLGQPETAKRDETPGQAADLVLRLERV